MSAQRRSQAPVFDWADVAAQKIGEDVRRLVEESYVRGMQRASGPYVEGNEARWAQIIREADSDDRNGALKEGLRDLARRAGKMAAKRDRRAKRAG